MEGCTQGFSYEFTQEILKLNGFLRIDKKQVQKVAKGDF